MVQILHYQNQSIAQYKAIVKRGKRLVNARSIELHHPRDFAELF